jgi:hypothetical protein
LCTLNGIVVKEAQLEQYVLRELRHLQEFLFHRFPPLAVYLQVPFDELINNVRPRTKGLLIDVQCGSSRQASTKPVLSPPTPRKREDSNSNDVTPKTKRAQSQPSASTKNRPYSTTSDSSSLSGDDQEDEYGFYQPLDE